MERIRIINLFMKPNYVNEDWLLIETGKKTAILATFNFANRS